MNDIARRPPKPPSAPPPATPSIPPSKSALPDPSPLSLSSNKPSKKRRIWWILLGIVAVVLALLIGIYLWYTISLQPLSSKDTSKVGITIAPGSDPSDISTLLEEKKLIRSSTAFDIYTRFTKTADKLQAGFYRLSPSESTQQIVDHIVSGKVDEFKITFLPGTTLAENRDTLLKAGYSAQEVDTALNKTYDHPLFTDKPASTDLEGYIFGETYHFTSNATVEQVLQRTFDEYWQVIQENKLIEGFKAQGLNLYQGITLASIIQREVRGQEDQKQVAQIFLKRFREGIVLGSDVTFIYAAKRLGVEPSVDLDSPYNTRKYPGLPPGPIATPGLYALLGVASPASGDYLYFLSGDDGKTYFAHTLEEHEKNIREHCQIKCQ